MSRRVVLLDGGMGQELLKRSKTPPTPLWSAQFLIDGPDIVEAVHAEYASCGCRVATLNTYIVTPERLERDGDPAQFETLHKRAIALARSGTGNAENSVTIAGCLPPLLASYRADVVPAYEEAIAAYRRIVAVEKNGVDLFQCETLSSVREVRAATTAAAESGKPVWTSMTVMDADGTKLRSGEPLADGVAAARECGAQAVLVNCSWPEAVGQAMPILALSGLPFGAYANGFTSIEALLPGGTVEELKARDDLDPERYAAHALAWVEAGASIVGGCCEVGPAHMRYLRDRLVDAEYEIAGSLDG
jgi:homocysteine S-methyltransferase